MLNSFFKPYIRKSVSFIQHRPFLVFFSALLFLFLLIVLGDVFQKSTPQSKTATTVKLVKVYTIGQTPKATFQAKIEKTGVIKIVSLAAGIVQTIFVNENDSVSAGTQILTLSSTYQGGNAPAIQAEIARTQYANVVSTFDQQNDALNKQRDLAKATHDNFSDMQAIATQSASDTNSLINANQTTLDQLNQQLNDAKTSGASISAQLSTEGLISQLQSGQNQLRQALSTLQLQTDSSKPAGRLADTQRDLMLEQLDIQAKALALNKEVSKLSADLAAVSAQTMYPASPFAGLVQRIYVRVGQQVTPGTVLAEISSSDKHATAVVSVPGNVAKTISSLEASTIHIGTTEFDVRPNFVSSEATDGLLYAVLYPLADTQSSLLTDASYVTINIPLGNPDTSSAVPFVPLDAIYQTQDTNYVLVLQGQKAVTREITLGPVLGSMVQITKGLGAGDQVVLDRTVLSGDIVTTH